MRYKSGYTLVELLIVIAIISILLGLLIPAVQRIRVAAAKSTCGNNLRQLGLGLHQYHGNYGTLPSGSINVGDTSGLRNASWLRALLPYVEQDALWRNSETASQTVHEGSLPPHLAISQTILKIFLCPLDTIGNNPPDRNYYSKYAFTSFQGVGGVNVADALGVLYLNSKIRFSDITDGTSNTLAIMERPPNTTALYGWWYFGAGINRTGELDTWMNAKEMRFDSIVDVSMCPLGPYPYAAGDVNSPCSTFHFWSHHSSGAQALYIDGSVRFLKYAANSVLPALCTRSGGEAVSSLD
jgi:prepilin-type N-terminal cleavage/methylation domain-containing protein/prepilin-type processing-associated H-X9-DG protein